MYCVTTRESFADVVQAGLKNSGRVFSSASEVIAALVAAARPKCRLLIVDLATISDAGRLIDFVKSSAPIKDTIVIAVGGEQDYAALEPQTTEAISGFVYTPFTATELAMVVAGLVDGQNSEAEGR